MNKLCTTKSGFTLVEVLVSVGILLVFLPFAASMISNSRLLASYSKHKIQAAYVAQQIIETQRQIISTYFTPPTGPLLTGQSKVITGPVLLDTKGNYAPINCTVYTPPSNLPPYNNPPYYTLPCGEAVITITPAVYTNNAGAQVTSTTTDHFVVTITWQEQILNLQVPIIETYAEDIANDPMLN